ncbi:MAG: hypothetical protein IPG64_10995 [Haliea sp.]|nr:hypothetical protein [Haliea sp.]
MSASKAGYPVQSLRRYKYWPPVNQVDGPMQRSQPLFCACLPAIGGYPAGGIIDKGAEG